MTAIDPNDGTPTLLEGVRPVNGTPVDASLALRVNYSFFIDVAHTANPNGRTGPLPQDQDTVINRRIDSLSGQTVRGIREAGAPFNGNPDRPTYDNELLNAHFVCGDGRCNENISLSTIHHIFHGEHNRLVDVVKRVLLDSGDLARLNQWLDVPIGQTWLGTWTGLGFPVSDASQANEAKTRTAIDGMRLNWNGERVFQAARFGTEMQYNRIVFDEFAPTLAGLHDVFEGFHTEVDPTISAEFSQSVYRFGHSMLTDTVDRYDHNFDPIPEISCNPVNSTCVEDSSQLGLFEAFLNPLALYSADANGVPSSRRKRVRARSCAASPARAATRSMNS